MIYLYLLYLLIYIYDLCMCYINNYKSPLYLQFFLCFMACFTPPQRAEASRGRGSSEHPGLRCADGLLARRDAQTQPRRLMCHPMVLVSPHEPAHWLVRYTYHRPVRYPSVQRDK